MILLFDIGNTHTHVGLANGRRVVQADQPAHGRMDRRKRADGRG